MTNSRRTWRRLEVQKAGDKPAAKSEEEASRTESAVRRIAAVRERVLAKQAAATKAARDGDVATENRHKRLPSDGERAAAAELAQDGDEAAAKRRHSRRDKAKADG